MQAFLDEFSKTLAGDEHAAVVVDQAGWHVAFALKVPDNITFVLLPPYSPECELGQVTALIGSTAQAAWLPVTSRENVR